MTKTLAPEVISHLSLSCQEYRVKIRRGKIPGNELGPTQTNWLVKKMGKVSSCANRGAFIACIGNLEFEMCFMFFGLHGESMKFPPKKLKC